MISSVTFSSSFHLLWLAAVLNGFLNIAHGTSPTNIGSFNFLTFPPVLLLLCFPVNHV